MPQCTCTSPDGTQSTTYVFESAPYGAIAPDCEIACRFWRENSSHTRLFPYGSPEREAKMGSCKMWVKECGSGWDFITLSEPRTQCVAGDSVGAKLSVDHGHSMGQLVDVSLKVVRASDEIVDVVEQNFAPDINLYAGLEGPLKTITNPSSPFYGQQVKTCMVNGFDSYVYQVTRYPSSTVDPIASTAWGDVDLSTGDNVGQVAVPLFKFRKFLGNVLAPDVGTNYALNPFYDPDAICSVEEYFDLTGLNWETMPGVGGGTPCEAKIRHLGMQVLGSGTNFYKSNADYELACRIELGELLPETDFNEMYNRNFSEQKMWQEWNNLSVECIEEEYPYDLDAYCALYPTNDVCTGYDVENNPLGTKWWSGTSNTYGGTINAFHPYYLTWLKGYLVNELGITALADADPMTLSEYHTNTTWNNFQISDEAIAYGANKRKLTACVVTKLYEKYPDQFDWRGAFPPSNVDSGNILLPEEMVGAYDWLTEDDVAYDGQVPVQTFSPTSNEYGYEAIEIPEGLVNLEYIEIPYEGQDIVAEFRGEVEVSEGINEARETLTDDTRQEEGVFLPEDPELEILGAEDDFIDSVERGQISEEDLSNYFSEESAKAVANMFDDAVDSNENQGGDEVISDDETIFDEGETDGNVISDDSFDGMGDPEDDAFASQEEEVTEDEVQDEVQDEPMDVIEEEFILEVAEDEIVPEMATTTVVEDVMDVDTLDDGVEKSGSIVPSSLKEAFQKPAVQAIAVACGIGLVAYFALGRKK